MVPAGATAQDVIASARSAAPASISNNATVMDWDLNVVSRGSNEWTCLPDRPTTPGNDPWCVTAAWLNFLQAYVNQTEPTYTELGFAYMMQGDTPVSNADPFATEETGPADWVTDLGPHLMMVVPNREVLKAISDGSPERRAVGHVAGHAVCAHHDPLGKPGSVRSVSGSQITFLDVRRNGHRQ